MLKNEIKVKAYNIRHLKEKTYGRRDCTIFITHSCSNEIEKMHYTDYLKLKEDLKARNIKIQVEKV